jgi:hypothetical protein
MATMKRKVDIKLDDKGKAVFKEEETKKTLTKKKADSPSEKIPEKKTLTAKTDNKKNLPVKAETKVVPEKAKEEPLPVKAEDAPKRPDMPADFCLQSQEDWDGNESFYDPENDHCAACAEDMPETAKVCAARSEFLKKELKMAKTRKASTSANRTTKSGIPTQAKIIDDGLLAKKDQKVIVAELAKIHYGGETEGAKALAMKRFDRHIKSIKDGSYCHAAAVRESIAYLKAATTAPSSTPAAKKH